MYVCVYHYVLAIRVYIRMHACHYICMSIYRYICMYDFDVFIAVWYLLRYFICMYLYITYLCMKLDILYLYECRLAIIYLSILLRWSNICSFAGAANGKELIWSACLKIQWNMYSTTWTVSDTSIWTCNSEICKNSGF